VAQDNTAIWETQSADPHLTAPVGVKVPLKRHWAAMIGDLDADPSTSRDRIRAARTLRRLGFNAPGLQDGLTNALRENPDWDRWDMESYARQKQQEAEDALRTPPPEQP